MKKYNIQNYIRYKDDLKQALSRVPDYGDDYAKYTRDELILKFKPLVESLARKFPTSQQATGVLTILDLLQFGGSGLIKAVDRKNFGKDEKMVAMFFNSIFLSIDEKTSDDQVYDIPDKSEPYNKELLNMYLKSLLIKHLNEIEYQVLRLSYGLDCDKHPAKKIASILNIKGDSSYVRVSQLKKQAVEKLIASVDHSQVLDYL